MGAERHRAGGDRPVAKLRRRLFARRDGADARVLAVEELEPLCQRALPKAAASSRASDSCSLPYCRSTSSGRPITSHTVAKNRGSSAATVSRRPSAVA